MYGFWNTSWRRYRRPHRPVSTWLRLQAMPALAWWGVLYIGVISTAVAFYLWNRGFELLDASAASLFIFAQPVVGGVLGWLLLHERLPASFFAGAAAIAGGLVLASRPDRTRPGAAGAAPSARRHTLPRKGAA